MNINKTPNLKEFPQIERHLNLIREKLWKGQAYGRAAVLVGAGFSRNAIRRSPHTRPIPLWSDIGRSMYKKLYPGQIPPQNIEAPKIATEFESIFGRQALEEFLINEISDKNYFPSTLHKLLLFLPWADIFTTNYDTLIESTRKYVHDRKYDLVRRVDEIPYASKPRIVKLHGTLPSFKPFIISEEDYRTYPTKFAPFVNIVQESIMENVLCLIGFTGNDPNFLNWIGWVRDNLGSSMPPVYLIAISELPIPQQKVYESRNIIPIDLSKLFPKLNYPDEDLRYYKSIEWFLWYLVKGAPLDYHRWPLIKSISAPFEMSKDLPEIPEQTIFTLKRKLTPSKKILKSAIQGKVKESEIKDDLKEIYKEWKDERELYPGWLVMPAESRENLWLYTTYWIEYIKYIEKLEPPYDLYLLYELNWRIEKMLMPLLSNWLEMYKRTIEKYNPFPSLFTIDGAQVLHSEGKYSNLDWSKISKQWVELAFTLSRDAREELNKKEFDYWMNRIQKVMIYNKEWKARWYYEKAMFDLLSLDLDTVNKILEDWPEDFEIPYWELKRASILAEIGELEKAEQIAEAVLSKVRSLQEIETTDYYLLSLEGWAMVLLSKLKTRRGKDEEVKYYKGRLYKLNAYLCNPYNEVESLKAKLTENKPYLEPSTETKRGFDPGTERTIRRFYGSSYVGLKILLPAFNFLRMLEEGSIPIRCDRIDMWSKTVVNALEWLKHSYPLFSVFSFLRTGKDNQEEVDKFFSRLTIATLDENEIERLINIFMHAWKQSIKHIEITAKSAYFSSFPVISFKMLSEVISRLCFRLETDQLNDIYKTVIHLCSLPAFCQFYEVEKNLLKRLFYSLPDKYIIKKLPELIALPIPQEDFQLSDNLVSEAPEPFNYVNVKKQIISKEALKQFKTPQWHKSIKKLVGIAKMGKVEPRKRAITRLIKLYDMNLLTGNEKKRFAEALWNKIDPKKNLPKNTGLTDSDFLFLPTPDSKDVKDKFKKYLLDYTILPLSGIPNISLNNFINSLLHSTKPPILEDRSKEHLYIEWNAKEISIFFEKIIFWWNEEKDKLRKYIQPPWREMFGREALNSMYKISDVFNNVIFPRLKPGKAVLKYVENFLEDTKVLGLHPLLYLPGVLMLYPDKYREVKESIKLGLLSSDNEEVASALRGIYYWTIYIENDDLKVPQELIDELANKILMRKDPALGLAIRVITNIMRLMPNALKTEQVERLLLTLQLLSKETKLPDKSELIELEIGTSNKQVSLDKILLYRRFSSELAFSLKNWYLKKKVTIPEIITECEQTYTSDILPEVRKIWH